MSQERTFFPELMLFKRTILEKFLLSLFHIYEQHPIYPYKDRDEDSKILIHPSYAKVDAPGKQPRLAVKINGYTFSLTDYLLDEMSREKVNKNGVIVGWEYEKLLNTSVTIVIQAYAEEEATDISDELAMLLSFSAKEFFRSRGLVVRGVQVSETELFNREQQLYQTMINVSMEVPWKAFKENKNTPIFQGFEMFQDSVLLEDSSTDTIHILHLSNFFVGQIIEVVSLKDGEIELMKITAINLSNSEAKVERGLFGTVVLSLPKFSKVIGYETSIIMGAVNPDEPKLILDSNFRNFFKIGTIVYIANSVSSPLHSLEKVSVNKKPLSDSSILYVKRGQSGTTRQAIDDKAIIFQPPEPHSRQYVAPNLNVMK